MFAEEIRRAVLATPRYLLAEISAAVWKGFAAGAVSEDEAQRLAELIEARKVVPAASAVPRKPVGSRPRLSASLERRRAWTGSGWMPPAIAARFTMGEAAAIGVIVAEVAKNGRCELYIGAIAGRAGVCATLVKRALRQARTLGVLHVEARRVARDRNLPNIVTIISRELELWVRTRARVERQRGGGTFVPTTTNHILSSSVRHVATGRTAGTFGKVDRKVWANRTKAEPAPWTIVGRDRL